MISPINTKQIKIFASILFYTLSAFGQTGYEMAAKASRIQYCQEMSHLPHTEPQSTTPCYPHRLYSAEGRDSRILTILTFDGPWEKDVVDALTGAAACLLYQRYGFSKIVFLEPSNGRQGRYVIKHSGKDRSLDLYQFAAFSIPQRKK